MESTKYKLTEAHRELLKPWADKWIANAMSCKPMDDADRDATRVALEGLYRAANLPWHGRVVFTKSPLVMAIAGSIGAGVYWLQRNQPKSQQELENAILSSIGEIARKTTIGASVTNDSWLVQETVDAVNRVIRDITIGPVIAGLENETSKWLASLCKYWYRMANGGNHWSGWVSYISFFRHIVQLPIDFSAWAHYETAAIHSSWRVMTPDFCIVSDRPEWIRVNAANQPHCDGGPSHRWRDGWELFYMNGVRVSRELALTPSEALDPAGFAKI